MLLRFNKRYTGSTPTLNVIPVIDILFQLIIFFALVGQFQDMGAEVVPVAIPDNCKYAQKETNFEEKITTVTVSKIDDEKIVYTVGTQKVTSVDYKQIVGKLVQFIDEQLKLLPAEKRVVALRIDKDIDYKDAQYALYAVAESSASDIRIAAMKEK
jgi:biopolymer transport protein ExbD